MSRLKVGNYVISNEKYMKNNYLGKITSEEVIFGIVTYVQNEQFYDMIKIRYIKILKTEMPKSYKEFKEKITFSEISKSSMFSDNFTKWEIPDMTERDIHERFFELEGVINFLCNENEKLHEKVYTLQDRLNCKIESDEARKANKLAYLNNISRIKADRAWMV